MTDKNEHYGSQQVSFEDETEEALFPRFIKTFLAEVLDQRLSDSAFRFLVYLRGRIGDNKIMWDSQERMAKHFHTTTKSIQRWTAELVNLGILVQKSRGYKLALSKKLRNPVTTYGEKAIFNPFYFFSKDCSEEEFNIFSNHGLKDSEDKNVLSSLENAKIGETKVSLDKEIHTPEASGQVDQGRNSLRELASPPMIQTGSDQIDLKDLIPLTEIGSEISEERFPKPHLSPSLSDPPPNPKAPSPPAPLPWEDGGEAAEVTDEDRNVLLEKALANAKAKGAREAERKEKARKQKTVKQQMGLLDKEPVPETTQANANDVEFWIADAVRKNFNGHQVHKWSYTGKDKKLARDLLDLYPQPGVVESTIYEVCSNWDYFKKKFKLSGFPSIGMFFGFHNSLFGEKVAKLVKEQKQTAPEPAKSEAKKDEWV